MPESTALTTNVQPPTDIAKVKETMERNEVLLSAKTQQMVNQMKDLSRHFYSVGKFKAADGTWQDKMEPDAFAIQTMSTVQQICTESETMIWEQPDDLLNAAVTVNVLGWKGPKEKPTIVKNARLRLSMRTIAMKYVMEKLQPKKRWNDATKRKEEMPAEWKEEDVTILPTGWIEPKDFAKRAAMFGYLADQLAFLGRTAETKAERRVNLKLLGFDWRDPDEITDEGGERAAVAATKEHQTADPAPILAQVEACKTISDLNALTPFLTVELGKLSDADQKKVMERVKEKRSSLAPVTLNVNDHGPKEIKKTEAEPAADIQPGEVVKGPSADDPMPEAEFDSYLESMREQATMDAVEAIYRNVLAKPLSPIQRGLLDTMRESCLKQTEKPKTKKKAA